MPTKLVTHTQPDLDAIASAWLIHRFFEPIAEYKFVNAGNMPTEKEMLTDLAPEDLLIVVDCGGQYDPDNLRFDHHHLPPDEANETCATMQVYKYLIGPFNDIEYLRPLIDLVFAGDTGRSEANESRTLGLHSILAGNAIAHRELYGEPIEDYDQMLFGFRILDNLAIRLKRMSEAKTELIEKVVYKSDDGLVWAIKHGSVSATFAAEEEGAVLVVWEGKPIEENGQISSQPVGISRTGGAERKAPHVGKLVENYLTFVNQTPVAVASEMKT
jgi:hypothetical protein